MWKNGFGDPPQTQRWEGLPARDPHSGRSCCSPAGMSGGQGQQQPPRPGAECGPESERSGRIEGSGAASAGQGQPVRPVPRSPHPVLQDAHHAARTTHYGSLPPKAQHGRPQDENPVVHFFKNIVSAVPLGGAAGPRARPPGVSLPRGGAGWTHEGVSLPRVTQPQHLAPGPKDGLLLSLNC